MLWIPGIHTIPSVGYLCTEMEEAMKYVGSLIQGRISPGAAAQRLNKLTIGDICATDPVGSPVLSYQPCSGNSGCWCVTASVRPSCCLPCSVSPLTCQSQRWAQLPTCPLDSSREKQETLDLKKRHLP